MSNLSTKLKLVPVCVIGRYGLISEGGAGGLKIELIIGITRPSLIKEIPSQSGHWLLNESASS